MVVFVKGLEFHAHHGVTEEERRLGHRFRLDLSAVVSEAAAESDKIEDTVDYGEMARVAVWACASHPFSTVERASAKIAQTLFETFGGIESLTVSLAKLQPALPLQIEAVGVERVFQRP